MKQVVSAGLQLPKRLEAERNPCSTVASIDLDFSSSRVLLAAPANLWGKQIEREIENSLETRHNFHGAVEVGHVPAGEGHAQDAGEHRLAVLVRRLRDDQVRHPRAHLLHTTSAFLVKRNNFQN